jgi:hypothetical protein
MELFFISKTSVRIFIFALLKSKNPIEKEHLCFADVLFLFAPAHWIIRLLA